MKCRSKRNRKRPRGGIGCLSLADGGRDDDGSPKSPRSLLRVEVVPLSRAFDVISDCCSNGSGRNRTDDGADDENQRRVHNRRRVRIIRPYPFTFGTFAKARWIGRTAVDVYHEEFGEGRVFGVYFRQYVLRFFHTGRIYLIGSYPRSYYEAAIKAGRILVSGNKVGCDYKIKGGDELTHTVHRHEPAVGLADVSVDESNLSANQSQMVPPVEIVHEDDSLLVVDKPATLPIHPCGGYNFNSLFEILSHWKQDFGKLFTVHRLDRLTSGLVIIAKSSALARSLGKCIMDRDGCEKIYLSRVKGRFPLNLQTSVDVKDGNDKHPWEYHYIHPDCDHDAGVEATNPTKRIKRSSLPPCQYGEVDQSGAKAWGGGLRVPVSDSASIKKSQNNTPEVGDHKGNGQSYAGLGYWMTDGRGAIIENASLQDLINQCENVPVEEMLERAIGSTPTTSTGNDHISTQQSMLWLNFSCPCRISSHKNGVCEAGSFSDLNDENARRGIKPAQTSFALLSYDAASDTSLVVAKPVTGRTHQIRLHLKELGHPIANDHCYGGELWFGDEEGKKVCNKSREWLDRLDRGEGAATASAKSRTEDGDSKTNAETPATEAEIYHAAADRPREDGESILDFIEKTCVWCARCRGVDDMGTPTASPEAKLKNEKAVFRRTLMEYLVRSQGIWLHALQYSLKMNDESGQNKMVCYRTGLPSWAM